MPAPQAKAACRGSGGGNRSSLRLVAQPPGPPDGPAARLRLVAQPPGPPNGSAARSAPLGAVVIFPVLGVMADLFVGSRIPTSGGLGGPEVSAVEFGCLPPKPRRRAGDRGAATVPRSASSLSPPDPPTVPQPVPPRRSAPPDPPTVPQPVPPRRSAPRTPRRFCGPFRLVAPPPGPPDGFAARSASSL